MRSMKAAMVVVALALIAGGCASTPPEEDPVQIKLNDLDARLSRIERANQSTVEMAQHLEAVQTDVRELRGQIEELQHENAELRKQQHDLYADLDKRVKALESGSGSGANAAAAAPGPAGAAGAAGSAPADAGSGAAGGGGEGEASGQPSSVEQAVYNQSFDALKAGSFSTAITGFKDFLTNYPQSPLASNAQYWLGEAHYVNHEYDAAAEAFRAVLRKWPDSRKAPDALLKLGYTQYEQKQYAAARATLTDVSRKYPGTDSAKLAADYLRRIPAQ